MILSNVEIVRCLDESLFSIEGMVERDPTRAPYNTSAVDLGLGNEVVMLGEGMPAAIDLRSSSGIARFLQAHSRKVVITDDPPFTLTKGRFVLANTLERVEFPLSTSLSYSARVEGKSSLDRCGILIHFTAPTIHAGFGGHITLEMINLSDMNFLLYPGMYICQLIVEEVKGRPQQAPNQFTGQTSPVGVTN
jgi:dCTP deaminase